MKQKIIAGIIIIAFMVVGGLAIYAWFFKTSGDKPTQQWAESKPAPEVKGIPQQEVVIKHIHVYEKKEISKKLDLPKEITDDPNQQVTGTTEVGSSEHDATVATIVNTESGETKVISKEKPYETFEFQNKGEIGLLAGPTTKGTMLLAYAQWSPIRIKGVNVTIMPVGGSVGKDPFVGALGGLTYKW